MKFKLIHVLLLFALSNLHANLDLVNSDNLSTINSLIGSEVSINLNDIRERAFNIKYSNGAAEIHRVEFSVNGKNVSSDNLGNPYYMYRNSEAWVPVEGTHTITASAYNSSNNLLAIESVNIIISDDLSHRKRKVYISTGTPNTEVQVKMKKHAYIFGSQTVESGNLNANGDPSDQQYKPYPIRISGYQADDSQMEYINKYREVFLNNFNMTVAGNAMKWYSTGNDGTDFTQADRWLAWHEANDIAVRGHTLLWGRGGPGGTREMYDPEWIENLIEGDDLQKEQAKLAIKNRIQTIVSHYAGRIDEWDFNNELWNGDKYRKEFDGQDNSKFHNAASTFGQDSILAEFASWAKEANPDIKLYFNDYNIITGGTTGNAQSFRNLLIDLRDNHGVPVDGIGVQGHFGGGNSAVRSKEQITACFDVLSEVGVPIKVTELDVGGVSMSESNRAQLLENVYRAAFEHDNVEGVLMWGFWSGCHWRRERAPWQYVGYAYNDTNIANDEPANWIETEQVDRYRSLVFDEWWTDSTLLADESGMIEMSVFAGDYDLIIDGTVFQKSILVSESDEPYYLTYTNGSLDETDGEFKISYPFEGEVFGSNEQIFVNASFPNGSTNGVDFVEFYVNGDFYKRDSVAPFQMTLFELPIGIHSLSITGQGNQVIYDSLDIEVSEMVLDTSLIGNSGFESGNDPTSGGLLPFGSVDLTLITGLVHSGTKSLYVQRNSSDSTHDWHGVRYDFDSLEVGATYQFSSKLYLLNDNSSNLRLRLKIVDPSTGNVSYPAIKTIETPEIGSWIDLSHEFIYDSSHEFIYLSLSNPGDDYILDDIYLSKLSPANPDDSDNDGLSDIWEMNNLSSLAYMATDDPDGDGFDNLYEYRSGTDPNNIGSFFMLLNSNFSHGLNQDTLQWLGHPSMQYRVMSKTDLGASQWVVEEEAIEGNISTFNIWNGNHEDYTSKFYKIEIDQ